MKKDLIISLAVKGREDYHKLLEGLESSIEKHWDGDKRIMRHFPDGVTPHSVMPYQFKFDLIEQARNDGYTRIWWMDSTMRLLKDPTPLLDNSKTGIVAFDNEGHPLRNYISDDAVHNLIMEDLIECYADIDDIPQIWGGCIAFDFNKYVAQCAFKRILLQIDLGSFSDGFAIRKGFIRHRHDQAVMSVIFNFYRVDILPYGIISSKADKTEQTVIQYGS